MTTEMNCICGLLGTYMYIYRIYSHNSLFPCRVVSTWLPREVRTKSVKSLAYGEHKLVLASMQDSTQPSTQPSAAITLHGHSE